MEKPIDQIAERDLAALIEVGTPELKTIEYKQVLPGNSDDGRKEFLADVSSFANSAGGHLIYGMREDDGVAVELSGVVDEGDEAILRMEGMIRDGIAPRIAGVHSTAVKLANKRTAIVIRVPKSFASPHMVTFKNTSRFYARSSNGKFQLNVDEIRAAFLGSETTAEHIRNFRLDRVANIRGRETAIPLRNGPCVTLHIVPVSAFGGTRYDVTALKANAYIFQNLAPLFQDFVNNSRINFDGLLVHNTDSQPASEGYSQIYRNGIIETAEARLISLAERFGKGKVVSSLVFELRLVRSLRKYLSVLQSLAVDLPLLLMVSLLDVRGYTMGTPQYAFLNEGMPFDKDVLMPQEVLIDSYAADLPLLTKPIFDEISNAAGFRGAVCYKDGKWIGEELAQRFGA